MTEYCISNWISYTGWTEYEVSLTREEAAEMMHHRVGDFKLSKDDFMAMSEEEFLLNFKEWVSELDAENLSLNEVFGDEVQEDSHRNITDSGPFESYIKE